MLPTADPLPTLKFTSTYSLLFDRLTVSHTSWKRWQWNPILFSNLMITFYSCVCFMHHFALHRDCQFSTIPIPADSQARCSLMNAEKLAPFLATQSYIISKYATMDWVQVYNSIHPFTACPDSLQFPQNHSYLQTDHAVSYMDTNISEECTATLKMDASIFLQNSSNHLHNYMVSKDQTTIWTLITMKPSNLTNTHTRCYGICMTGDTKYKTQFFK
jgi:hypothetical protein